MLIVTAEITAYDTATPGELTLRYSTHGYVSGPTESPANTYWDNRIIQGGNFQRTMFQNQQTFGQTQLGYGELVLANFDGGLDALLNYSFGGRRIVIRLADVDAGAVPTWTIIIDGLIEQAELSWQAVRFRVRDKQLAVAKPLQQVRYGGTNALPAGLDGVAGDLKGRPKPLVYGQIFNAAAPCVNTTRKIYQLHSGSALQSVDAVYNRGAALTAGAVYTSQADMETTAPAAGQYRVWNDATAGCFVRLADNTQGTLTFDATQGAAAANRTAGQLWSQILQKAGVSAGAISSADITALDTVAPYACGIYIPESRDMSAIEAIDMLCMSVGAWWGVDSGGTYRIAQLVLPNIANSVTTLTTVNIVSIDRVASRDAGAGMPAWKIKMGYQRIWFTQDDLTNAVTEVRKEFLANEYRRVEANDNAILTANPTSPEIEINTVLVTEANASTEAARRLSIYKQRRDFYQVTVRVDATTAPLLDLGRTVTLQVNRFGMNSGKAFVITGIQADLRQYLFTLTLWG
jgi:hypothetical protein